MEILSFDRSTDKKIKIAAYLTLLISFGFAGWIATFVNFSVEVANINALDLGLIWSVKEIPIILGFILAIVLSFISESRILGIFVAITGLGIILTGFADYDLLSKSLYDNLSLSKFTFHMLIITFILSMGYNYFNTARDNLLTHSTASDKTAVCMGKIAGYGIIGTISGFTIVTILGFSMSFIEDIEVRYTIIYIVIGLPLIIGGILGSQQSDPTKNLKENIQLTFDTKFLRFYILTFFDYAIYYLFIPFGIYRVLTIEGGFKVTLGMIGGMFLIHILLIFFFRRRVNDLVNAKGIAFIMHIKYGGLLVVSLSFAFIHENITLMILAFVFGVLQLFDSIAKTYMQGISQPNEIRANLVIHDRITHFAAIVIPILSGFIWYKMGDNGGMYAFILGGIFALICLIISFFLYPASLFEDE